ncbi:MAG: ABC transporter permease [Candidatus Heimdallarchaeota archaeon]|nr:ABC transporter permease [Candidatus Heimdallarchaeota archaeon]
MEQLANQTVTYDQGLALSAEILKLRGLAGIEIADQVIYNYAPVEPDLTIWTLDFQKPWFGTYVKPSLINNGAFPKSNNQALVITGTSQVQKLSTNGVNLTSIIAVGQTLEFTNNKTDVESFEIVGNFDGNQINIPRNPDGLWLFIDQSRFDDMLGLFGMTVKDSFTYGISFAVPGNLLDTNTLDRVKKLNDEIQGQKLLTDSANYGGWRPIPSVLPTEKAAADRAQLIVFLLFIVIGGVVMTTMLSFLVSRFRSREIAILKAMGYSRASVRLSLIAEIMTTASVGFFVGIGSAQGLLLYLADFDFKSLLSTNALFYSFLINVVITLPGMFFASWRILKISPSEAFRDRG